MTAYIIRRRDGVHWAKAKLTTQETRIRQIRSLEFAEFPRLFGGLRPHRRLSSETAISGLRAVTDDYMMARWRKHPGSWQEFTSAENDDDRFNHNLSGPGARSVPARYWRRRKNPSRPLCHTIALTITRRTTR
jgi:hypothetical protein